MMSAWARIGTGDDTVVRDKVRKALWSRSGNRCAMCQCELTVDATDRDEESIVGEECHIVSARPDGPRHDTTFPRERLDEAENLILLCRVHHKIVDDQVETYTASLLRDLKKQHEKWVSASLDGQEEVFPVRIRSTNEGAPTYLRRLMSGQETADVVGGACAYRFEHDELASEEEAELVAAFFQELEDWVDVWDDAGAGGRVNAAFGISNRLRELDSAGLWVFGARELQQIEGGGVPPSPWPVGIIRVLRQSNPEILRVEASPIGLGHEDDR